MDETEAVRKTLINTFEGATASTDYDVWVPTEKLPQALRLARGAADSDTYKPEIYPSPSTDDRVCLLI